MEHAQSLLTAQGLDAPLENATTSGTFADGMTWSLKIHVLPRSAATPDDAVGAVDFARSAEGRHMEAQGERLLAQQQAAEQSQAQDRQMTR